MTMKHLILVAALFSTPIAAQETPLTNNEKLIGFATLMAMAYQAQEACTGATVNQQKMLMLAGVMGIPALDQTLLGNLIALQNGTMMKKRQDLGTEGWCIHAKSLMHDMPVVDWKQN